MEHKTFIKCNLYSIPDDFSILGNRSVDDSLIDSEKKFVRTIIVYIISGHMSEFLTGVDFDYSDIRVYEKYSRFQRKNIVKEKSKISTQPIHVCLYSEDLNNPYTANMNYEYVDDDDIQKYYHDIILEFDTIENYKNYLLTLKQNANDKLDDAIKDHGRSKRISLIRKV